MKYDFTTILDRRGKDAIAIGNIGPTGWGPDGPIRPVYFCSVDTSDFSANKLADRGSLSAKGIVANAQDFITKAAAALGL